MTDDARAMANRRTAPARNNWGWTLLLLLIFIFTTTQIWLMMSISSLDGNKLFAANSPLHVNITELRSQLRKLHMPSYVNQSTLITNKYNQSPIVFAMSPGTTGTHTHFMAACRLGLPSIHHTSFCASPSKDLSGVSQQVIDGLQAHAHIFELNELAYKCTMGAKAKGATSKYYKMFYYSNACNMDVRDWAAQTQENISKLLSSGIVGIFDYPYPNMIDFILNTIPKVRGETFQPTLIYTKRESNQWRISRLKHGFLLCKEDYENIESKLNNTQEVSSANSYHGKVPLYLTEFNIFECIDRADSKSTSDLPITISDVFEYESNKQKTPDGKKIKYFIKRKRPGLYQALQSSYEWHQQHYSVVAQYTPDFFGVDSPKQADADNRVQSKGERIDDKVVAQNLLLVLKRLGFLHRGGKKHALPLVPSSLQKLKQMKKLKLTN